MAFVQLSAIARGDRHAATSRVSAAFDSAGACITDVRFFSGVLTVLTFQVAPARVRPLLAVLRQAGLELEEPGVVAAEMAAITADDVEGTLAVTFPDGDPDLEREVPAVPG